MPKQKHKSLQDVTCSLRETKSPLLFFTVLPRGAGSRPASRGPLILITIRAEVLRYLMGMLFQRPSASPRQISQQPLVSLKGTDGFKLKLPMPREDEDDNNNNPGEIHASCELSVWTVESDLRRGGTGVGSVVQMLKASSSLAPWRRGTKSLPTLIPFKRVDLLGKRRTL